MYSDLVKHKNKGVQDKQSARTEFRANPYLLRIEQKNSHSEAKNIIIYQPLGVIFTDAKTEKENIYRHALIISIIHWSKMNNGKYFAQVALKEIKFFLPQEEIRYGGWTEEEIIF